MKSIGIVGQGFVGTSVREKMRENFLVYTYDKYNKDACLIYNKETAIQDHSIVNIETLVKECEVIFICVPTPMFEDGECDTSIVRSVIEDISTECDRQEKSVITVIKSTISPGTTQSLNDINSRVGVTFSPEFLTEANAIEDFKNQKRIVLGIDWAEYVNPVSDIFSESFPEAEIILMNSKEAELVKYMTNLFLATKVSFFNDMYQICQKLEADYDQIVEATLADPRIGKSHYKVPGPDGDLGYGGHCLPGTYEVSTRYTSKTLEQLYDDINSGVLHSIKSTNSSIDTVEYKDVLKVTKNRYEGELFKFTLDDGSVIECTPEHLFPVYRNGEMILSKACDIIDTDEFYTELEITNKKTLTSNANQILG